MLRKGSNEERCDTRRVVVHTTLRSDRRLTAARGMATDAVLAARAEETEMPASITERAAPIGLAEGNGAARETRQPARLGFVT